MSVSKGDLAARLESMQPVSGIRAVTLDQVAADVQPEAAATVAKENALDLRETMAFEQAGWRFIRIDDAHATGPNQNVVVDGDGHLKIVSNALNVRFDPKVSRSAVDDILKHLGLGVRRDLGFSANLYLVSAAGGGVMEKAKSLNNRDDVVYAEPVLIEAIGRR